MPLDTVEAESPEQLDDGRLIVGKVSLLSGDAGSGKTQIALSIAAAVSTGRPIFPEGLSPGSHAREPANVLLLVGEDGVADTIRPRIDLAGGDPRRIYVFRSVKLVGADGEAVERDFDLQQVEVLEDALARVRPLFVVVDPVQLYLGPRVDMHRANEVRAALKATTTLAQKYSCAFLLVAHLNKRTGKALYRSLGSVDFVALSRSVLITGEHRGEKALAHAKASLTPRAPTHIYRLDGGVLTWAGTSDATADDLTLGGPESNGVRPRFHARRYLEGWLEPGPVRASEIIERASKVGIAAKTLYRAKAELGVRAERVGVAGGGGYWVWSL